MRPFPMTVLLRNRKVWATATKGILNPQAHAIFYGTATVTAEGAEQHIDLLAKRFLRMDKYPWRKPGEKRLIVRTHVDRIASCGL